ncbi:DUF1840 domain-containing protein [Polaromonas jejuensis]|uniref:DUF1840 domain-containing protein n=1 Tax=Polaromonas jejuensis TaxID=457502 RepID=A0ABW0Q7S7_9BURK|nr:DUF1840 domain-containing protein [Polaromonas jejuensis]
MLYKFKSKDIGDVIMLEPNGRQMLEIIGKEAGPRGIILPEQMAAAIAALKAAIADEEARDKVRYAEPAGAAREDELPSHGDPVALRQRAQPFIEMLQHNLEAGHQVVWGV